MSTKATALQFLPERDMAPRIVASAEGTMAEEILRLAKKNGVEIVKDPHLADTLTGLQLGTEIPENLYRAVAILFQFLWEKDPKK